MNDGQWRSAWEIFRTANDLEGDQRRSFLASVRADAETLEEVAAMLNAGALDAGALDQGPLDEGSGEPPGEPSRIGARFGHYQITGRLGSGGMGEVYAAHDGELDRMVAIKFLAPEMAASQPAVERLVREAKAASALNHPHIVTIHEVIRTGGDVAIAMELVEGTVLRKFCGKPVELAKAIEWGRHIAQALAAAHQRQIIHRDIKPDNLMVREDGIVKVLDFGVARHGAVEQGGRSTHSLGLLAGTLNYMSPEQTRVEAATSASDIFSLGIVLYELLVGAHPFRADSPIDTAHAIAHAEPKRPSTVNPVIPSALDTLLLAMLDKDPGKRPTAVEVDRWLSEIGLARELSRLPLPHGRGSESIAGSRGSESNAGGRGSESNVGSRGSESNARSRDSESIAPSRDSESIAGGHGSETNATSGGSENIAPSRASDRSRDREGAVFTSTSRPLLRVAAAVLLVSISAISLFWLHDRLFARKEPEATQLTAQVPENRVEAAAISPDGKILAFAAMGGSVLLRRMSDGFTRPLNTPEGLRVDRIAWFPDESKLLVSGSAEANDASGNEHPGVWVMPAGGGAAVKIVDDARDGVPSPDGARVAVSSAGESIVWVAAADGSGARQIRSGGQTSSFSALLWSPDGKRLAYQRRDSLNALDRAAPDKTAYLVSNYRYSYEAVEVETGRVTASAPDVVMAASCGLPDGRILYLRWPTLPLQSFFQVWELRTDPASGKLLAPPRQLTRDEHSTWSSISASSDGKQVVAVKSRNSIANIYVADLPPEGEIPRLINRRRLTFTEAQEFPHTWTADSRTIIFESDRNGSGRFDLYGQNLERREAEPLVLSPTTKVMAHVTSDGKWLLYRESRAKGDWNVTRIPVGGGTPRIVLTDSSFNSEFRCGLKAGARCVLRMVENDQLVFYELDPVRGKGRELARTGWGPLVVGDWDISPDGSQVAIPNHDPRDAKLRLVALDPGRDGVREETVTLSGLKNLNGVVSAASGRGWYVAVRTAGGGSLIYVDLQGRHTNLLGTTTPTYAVPSPDGRRIAFPDWSVSSNAWLFHGLQQ